MKDIINQLLEHEGCIPYAYLDGLGYLTIGVGRLIDHRKGGGLSNEECRVLLVNDIERVKRELDKALPWWRALDEVRSRVLIDMAFNLGIRGLLKFTKTLASIKSGNYEAAAREMLNSKWATQVGKRATRLSRMLRTGQD